MAELINLRTVRKRKARATREQQAAENRDKFGRSKLAKNQTEISLLREKAQLDGHKLNDTPDPKRDECEDT